MVGVAVEDLDYRHLRARLHNIGRRVLTNIETTQNGDAAQKPELYYLVVFSPSGSGGVLVLR
jgi:hypothetical protein